MLLPGSNPNLPSVKDIAFAGTVYRLEYELGQATGLEVTARTKYLPGDHLTFTTNLQEIFDDLSSPRREDRLLQEYPVNCVLQSGGEDMNPARAEYGLTRRALRVAQKLKAHDQNKGNDFAANVDWDRRGRGEDPPTYCIEAEAQLARSLYWLDKRFANHKPGSNDHAPTLIYTNEHDEPYAIQKSGGPGIAYIIRDSLMPTQGGARFVAANSFVEVAFDPTAPSNPNQRYKGAGAVLVKSTVTVPDTVLFGRFSASELPPAMHNAAINLTVPHDDNLALGPFVSEARKIVPAYIDRRVQAIVQRPDIQAKLVTANA